MFYAPELLSLKNKTEISIVYYMSTSKGHKRLGKKTVNSVDIRNVLADILHPKIPFSLRLYAYILDGIVKVWIIQIKYFFLSSKKSVPLQSRPRNKVRKSPNLCIEDIFIESLKDSVINDAEQGNYDEFDYPINDCTIMENQIEGSLEFENRMGDSVSSIELGRKNSSSFVLPQHIPKIKIKKIDEINELSNNQIILKKRRLDVLLKFDEYISGEIVNLIKNMFKCSEKSDHPVISNSNLQDPIEYFSNQLDYHSFPSSIEECRISDSKINNSVISSNQIISESERSVKNEKADWFYNLLVDASKGKIKLYQKEPYAEIMIISDF